jgi:hypothetical protein
MANCKHCKERLDFIEKIRIVAFGRICTSCFKKGLRDDKKVQKVREDNQKAFGWSLIIMGVLLCLTIFGAIIGIPLMAFGFHLIRTKPNKDFISNFIRNQELLRKKLERRRKK